MKKKKTGKIIGGAVGGMILVMAVVGLAMFGNLLSTMLSVKVQDGGVYEVAYKENYKLDELLAQGGVSNEDELVQYILKIMLKGLPIDIPYQVPELGCSTFATAQTDGGYVFGRNYDNQEGDLAVVHCHPDNGYSSVSVVSLSFLGYNAESTPQSITNRIRILATPYFPLDGVNEKGVAVGVLQLFAPVTNQQTDKVDVDTTLAIRIILDKAATVEEAVELLSGFDMHASAGGCYHLHIADASGKSVIISYVNDEMVVTEKTGAYQVATNFYVHDVPFTYKKHGEDRYQIISEGIEKANGRVTLKEGMGLLQAACQEHTVGSDGNIYTTQWSSVYDLTNPSLTLCSDMDYDNPRTFTLN